MNQLMRFATEVAFVGAVLSGVGRLAAESPKLRTILEGHSSGVMVAHFSPDGKRLATHDGAGPAFLWDLGSGKRIEVGERAEPLMFSPDGKLLILSGEKTEVQIYEISSGKTTVAKARRRNSFYELSPNGEAQFFHRASEKNQGDWVSHLATPYDIGTGRNPIALEGEVIGTAQNYPHSFTADGKTLVTVSLQGAVTVWDVGTGKRKTLPDTADQWFALSPDSRTVLASCRVNTTSFVFDTPEYTYKVFDIKTGNVVVTLKARDGDIDHYAIFSPDSKTIASGDVYEVKLWNASTGELVRTLERAGSTRPGQIRFLQGGRAIVARGGQNKARQLYIWDTATGRITGSLPGETTLRAISSDGQIMATARDEGAVAIYDLPAPKRSTKK